MEGHHPRGGRSKLPGGQQQQQQRQQQQHPALVVGSSRGSGGAAGMSSYTDPSPGAAAVAGPSQQPPQQQQQQQQQPKPIRRRMRMIASCLECRRRKLRCNKTQPCVNCSKAGGGPRDCVYLGPTLDEASQLRLTEIKEKVGRLEMELEVDARGGGPAAAGSVSPGGAHTKPAFLLADEVEDPDLDYTPMVALDLTYDDNADGTDDIIDLGIKIGKMRITERIGGLSRPRISEEISAGLAGGQRGGGPPPGFPPGGPPPGGGMGMGAPPGFDGRSDTTGSDGSAVPDFLRPGSTYIPPTSGFFFGQVVHTPSILSFLPTRPAADRLMLRYFRAVHSVAPCLHRPSFQASYLQFWDDVNVFVEPKFSVQAVVFAAMFSAAVSMGEPDINREFGLTKINLVESLKVGTETALSKANFLRTTSVETMQAFVMYMIPLCRAEVSRAHSVLVGAAIRMAECMGLHRDGENYGLTPLETHVRRLVWHQLCFLDVRTCEAQGPRPAIRRDDYDTKLPLNVDEDELALATAQNPPRPANRWTPALLAVIRFEINEMMRSVWQDRRRLEARRTSLTAVLTKTEEFRRRLFAKYEPLLTEDGGGARTTLKREAGAAADDDHADGPALRLYTRLVMHLLAARLHAMVLHPYHSNAAVPLPPRLASVLIMSGVLLVELGARLETDPALAQWAWYQGAYTQYHIALLLATEVYYRPDAAQADRIWACLDYIFELDPAAPKEAKGTAILREIMGKTAVYMGMRRMRAPAATQQAVPGRVAVDGGVPRSSSSSAIGSSSGGSSVPSSPSTAAAGGAGMQPQMHTPPPPQHQRGPPPPQMPANVVFAGVSNGEALWSLPPQGESPESDGSGGGGRSTGAGFGRQHQPQQAARMQQQQQMQQQGQPPAGGGPLPPGLEGLDWDALDSLFPSDPRTGQFNMPGYYDPNLAMRWPGQQ